MEDIKGEDVKRILKLACHLEEEEEDNVELVVSYALGVESYFQITIGAEEEYSAHSLDELEANLLANHEDEPLTCSNCSGTAIGDTPDTVCTTCKGSGIEPIKDLNYEDT